MITRYYVGGQLVATGEEEMRKYQKMLYDENIAFGGMAADECTLDEWIASDSDMTYKYVGWALYKQTREVPYRDKKEIKQGCVLDQTWQEPEFIEKFDTKEEALKELKNYKSKIEQFKTFQTFYTVTEWYIEEVEYNEEMEAEGEYEAKGNILDFSEFPKFE